MTAPTKPPKQFTRTQFGKRKHPPKQSLAQQQRKVAAYLNMLKIASEEK